MKADAPKELQLGFGAAFRTRPSLRRLIRRRAFEGLFFSLAGLWPEAASPPPVFILGMHRSGTSCLASLLAEAGLFLGETWKGDRFNEPGYFENEAATHFDHGLLTARGASWLHPTVIEKASPWERCFIRGMRRRMIREAQGRPWGLKDPRLMWCVKPWAAGRSRRLVGIFRHPAAVRDSLLARSENAPGPFDGPLALHAWKRHAQRLLELYEKENFPILCFDDSRERFQQSLAKAVEVLGLSVMDARAFREDLRHKTGDNEKPVDEDCRRIYDRLRDISEA